MEGERIESKEIKEGLKEQTGDETSPLKHNKPQLKGMSWLNGLSQQKTFLIRNWLDWTPVSMKSSSKSIGAKFHYALIL